MGRPAMQNPRPWPRVLPRFAFRFLASDTCLPLAGYPIRQFPESAACHHAKSWLDAPRASVTLAPTHIVLICHGVLSDRLVKQHL